MIQKISTAQAAMLVFNAIVPTATVVLPIILGTYLEQDSPIGILFSACVGMAIAALIGSIIKYNQGAPFLEWIGKKSSRWLAIVLGIFLLQYYLDASAAIMREFVNFLKDNVLLQTPVFVLVGTSLLIIIYAVHKGIEAIARVNSILVLLHLLFLPLFMFGLGDYLNVHRLLPMFQHSFASVTLASLTPVAWMSEVSILLFLAPYLKSPDKARRIGWIGLLFVTVMMQIIMLTTLMTFGPEYLKSSTYPGFVTFDIIHFGNFWENLNIVFISYWILSVYMKLAMFLFATMECFKQTFRVRENGPYLIGLALIIAAECLFTWKQPAKLNEFNAQGRFPVYMLINVLIPLSIYLCCLVKRTVAKRKGQAA
ncbi:Spore germination protein YndE [compost metagenome]